MYFTASGAEAEAQPESLSCSSPAYRKAKPSSATPECSELILSSSQIPAQKPFTITGTSTERACTKFYVTQGSGSRNDGGHPAAIFTTSKGRKRRSTICPRLRG